MATFSDIFPKRLTRIDELIRPDHYHLGGDDICMFLGECTARKGFSFSETNQNIFNFKKSVHRRHLLEWTYKERAIKSIGQAFGIAIKREWLAAFTLVPMPPSKAKSDPLYDDRMVRMLHCIPNAAALDIRELLIQNYTLEAAHDAEKRPGPDDLIKCYSIDPTLVAPVPIRFALFDDVITTGAHFVAAKSRLQARFPGVPVIGFFVARRAPDTSDVEEFLGNRDF